MEGGVQSEPVNWPSMLHHTRNLFVVVCVSHAMQTIYISFTDNTHFTDYIKDKQYIKSARVCDIVQNSICRCEVECNNYLKKQE